MLNPTRFLVKKVFDDEYVLESSTITDREVIEDMFVSEKDVLWYIEFYDYFNYEGYIVETPNGARAKVYFDEQDLMYKAEIPSTEIFSLAKNIPLKVIGNIYENEDLLYKEN